MRSTRILVGAVAVLALVAPPSAVSASSSRGLDRGDVGQLRPASGQGLRERPHAARDAARARATADRVKVLGHADPGGGFNADVFAYREFAYLASWGAFEDEELDFCPSQGVRVYDLHDPRHPSLVSTFGDEASEPDLAGTWTEKVIVRHVRTKWFRGDLATASIQGCADGAFTGFGLWDVTHPSRPVRLALFETPNTGGSHEIWMTARGDRAYVYTAIPLSELTTSLDFDPDSFSATTPGKPDFRIVDVSNPSSPTQVGAWGAWAELGRYPLQGQGTEDNASFVHSVITNRRATRAYVSYWDFGTVILDISDPTAPAYLGHTTFAPDQEGNAHSSALGRGGRLLIQTDEDFDPAGGDHTEQSWGYPRFFDVSDPSEPELLSTFTLPTTAQDPPPLGFYSVHDAKLRGSRAYFSWYSEGVVVLDVSRPRLPRLRAQFVPPATADPQGFFGPFFLDDPSNPPFPFVWGVFPHHKYVLASDINSGLWVLQVR